MDVNVSQVDDNAAHDTLPHGDPIPHVPTDENVNNPQEPLPVSAMNTVTPPHHFFVFVEPPIQCVEEYGPCLLCGAHHLSPNQSHEDCNLWKWANGSPLPAGPVEDVSSSSGED